jgi:hypothetical protein
MKQSITEKKLTPNELKKREEVIKKLKANRSSLVKRYGKDAEKVMYGRATNIAKKTTENMNKDKVREMIKKTLMSPVEEKFSKEYDNDPALKGKQKSLPDALQKAIIKKSANEDIDLGHQDDEPDMLKASVYRIAQYAAGLYKMLDKYDQMDQEVDFPDWWQEKIHLAADYMDKAKHYLEFEEKQPALDAMIQEAKDEVFKSEAKANIDSGLVQKVERFVNGVAKYYKYDIESALSAIRTIIGVDENKVNEGVNEEEAEAKDAVDTVTMDVPLFIRMLEFAREDAKEDVDLHDVAEKAIEINKSKETLSMQDYESIVPASESMDEGLPKGFWKKETAELDESFEKLVGKLKKQGKSEKAAKAIAGAVAQYKAKGGGKGPTAKQAARLKEEMSDIDTLKTYVSKYTDNADKEISKYKLAGFQAFSEPVKIGLKSDMDFITWVQMKHDKDQLRREKGI